ncbi:MAG: hypothetical protein PHE24_04575 [Patescibacteria group bacterium]|nr:hypothetical protein [Patescibacteria group bacterium]
MKRLMSVLAVSVFVAGMIGCSNNRSPVSNNASGAKGNVELSIKMGKVGALAKMAKTAEINLDSLTLDLTATGEVPIHSVTLISGHDQQIVTKNFELAANKNWTVQARTYATEPNPGCPQCPPNIRQIHNGSTSFDVAEGNSDPVNLTINAQYSMLVTRINPIPDSCNRITLYQGSDMNQLWNMWADTNFAIEQRAATDTAKLRYDWLYVQSYSQNIQVVIRGVWNGVPMILYWGTFSIPQVVAGEDVSYAFTLEWKGPSTAKVQKTINVTVGGIGTNTIDGTPIPPAPIK